MRNIRNGTFLAICLIMICTSTVYAETAPYDIHKEIPLRFHYGGAKSSGLDLSNPWIPLPPLFLFEFQGYFKQMDVPMEISIPGKLTVQCKSNDVWAGNTVPCRAWLESADDPNVPELSSNYGFMVGVKFRDIFWGKEFLDIGKDFALQISEHSKMPLGGNLLCGIDYVNFASLPIEEFIPGKSVKVEALKELIGAAGLGEFSLAGELIVKGNYVELFIDSNPVRFTGFRDAAAYPDPANDPNVETFALHVPEDLGNSPSFNPETGTVSFEPSVSYNMDLYKTAGLKFSLIGPLAFNFSPSVLDKGKNIMHYACPDLDTLQQYYTRALSDFSIRSDRYLNLSFPIKDTPFLPDLAVTEVLVNNVPYGKVFADEWTAFSFKITNIGERGTASPSDPGYQEPWFTYTLTIDGQVAYDPQDFDHYYPIEYWWVDSDPTFVVKNLPLAVIEKNGTHTIGTFVYKFPEGFHDIGIRVFYNEFKTFDQNGQPLYGVGDYNRSNNMVTQMIYAQPPRGTVAGRAVTNPCAGDYCGISGITVCLRDARGGSYYECQVTSSTAGQEEGTYRFEKVPTGDYALEYRPPQPTTEERAAGVPFYAPRSFSFHHEGAETDDFGYSITRGSMALFQYQDLKGYVKFGSAFVSGAKVQLGSAGLGAYGQTVTTNENGLFVFKNVPPVGTYTLTVTHDNYQPATKTHKMSVYDSGWTEVQICNVDPQLGTCRNYITLEADNTVPILYAEPINGGGYGSGSLAFRIRSTDTNGKKTGSYRYWVCTGESGENCGTWSTSIPYPDLQDPAALADITAAIGGAVPEGHHRMFIRVEDLAGNSTVTYVTFTKDSIPPELSSVILKDPMTGDTTVATSKFVDVNLTINNGEAARMAVHLSNDAGDQKTWSTPFYFNCDSAAPCTLAVKEWQVTEVDQFSGNKTVYAKIVDSAGNTSVVGSNSISVDTTGTVVLGDGARHFNNTHVPLRINIVPPSGTRVYWENANDKTNCPLGSTDSNRHRAQTIVVPVGGPVTFNAFALAMDNGEAAADAIVGNPGPLSIKIISALDDSDPAASGATPYFSWSGGRTTVLNALSQASLGPYDGGGLPIHLPQPVTLNPGTYYLLVYATGTNAQNYYRLYCDNYSMTDDKPSFLYVPGTGWQPDPQKGMMGNSRRLSFSLWDNTPGEIRTAANGNCDSLSEGDWQTYDFPPTVSRAVDFTADYGKGPGLGPQTVCVEYRHANILPNRTYYDSIVIDTGLPTGTATLRSFDRSSMSAFIDLSATDTTTGVESISWKMGETWSYPQPFTPLTRIDNVTGNRIEIKFIDKAGNESAVKQVNVPDDVVAPVLGLLRINNGSGYTTNPQMNIRLEASDDRALAKIVYQEAVTGVTGDLLLNGTTHAADHSFTIPPKSINNSDVLLDGVYTYTFYVEDTAGNRSAPLQATITLDRKPPVIKNFYLESQTGRSVTTVPGIQMIFDAADNFGPLLMRYSFDNAAWIGPVAVANGQTALDITGPSPLPQKYVVYLELKDGAGNTTIAQAEIKTNRPPLTPAAHSPAGTIFSSSPRLTGSAFADQDGDTWDGSLYVVRKASDNSIVLTSGVLTGPSVYNYTILSGDLSYDVNYTWSARYRDSFGQWSGWSTPASFVLKQPVLTVNKDGVGSGKVTGSGGQIDCGSSCSRTYNPGSAVTLTAAADISSNFTGWSGACSGTGSCVLFMDDNKTVTAAFEEGMPPSLTLSTLSSGSYTNNKTLNISGTATDAASGIKSLTISGTAVTLQNGSFSHAVTLTEGPNTITTVATDNANNTTTDTRTITYDPNAPTLTITTPFDNIVTSQPSIAVTGSVDETATVTVNGNQVSVNNNIFTASVSLTYGINTIDIIATDRAGNTSSAKRTITYDNANPSLSITNPVQDITTSQNTLTLQGTLSDLTITTITITMDGNAYTPSLTNNAFSQPLTFTTQKTYPVTVTATDGAGNITSVTRNIIYDTTPPPLTLNQVTTPTNQTTQTLSGSREVNAVITVTCPTAAAGAITYPTDAAWSVTIMNLTQGSNTITITATDKAGNITTVNTTITLDTTVKQALITGAPAAPAKNTSLTLTVSGTGITAYKYKLDSNAYSTTGIPIATPISLTGLTEGAHTVSVIGGDAAENWQSEAAPTTAAWTVDTTAPVAVLTNTSDPTQIDIIFTEQVDEIIAADPGNYSIDKGLAVTGVTKIDTYTYRLTTSHQASGVGYTITIRNITDVAGNPVNTGIPFTRGANTPPGTPALLSPMSDSEVSSLTPSLTVSTVIDPEGDPVTYAFEISTKPDFSTPVSSTSGIIATGTVASWTTPSLIDHTIYYWRTYATDGNKNSTYMPTASFFVNTANDPPSVPTLNNPAHNSVVAALTPVLTVNPVIDIDRDSVTYEFELYRDSVKVLDASSHTPQLVVPVLMNNAAYTWRVRARDEHAAYSDWSPLWSFTVQAENNVYTLTLAAGWNFISLPIAPEDPSINVVLKDILQNVRAVWGYNNQNKEWLKYTGQGAGVMGQNALTTIEAGKGYWIYMNNPAILTTAGQPASLQAIQLYNGWNLVGYNGQDNTQITDAYISTSGLADKWVIIWGWENGQWYAKPNPSLNYSTTQLLNSLYRGKAYWIKMNTDVQWQQ